MKEDENISEVFSLCLLQAPLVISYVTDMISPVCWLSFSDLIIQNIWLPLPPSTALIQQPGDHYITVCSACLTLTPGPAWLLSLCRPGHFQNCENSDLAFLWSNWQSCYTVSFVWEATEYPRSDGSFHVRTAVTTVTTPTGQYSPKIIVSNWRIQNCPKIDLKYE